MAPLDAAPPSVSASRRNFRRHFAAYCFVNLGLTGANILTGAPWWAFWPFALWSVAVLVHYLFYKASAIDDAWVDRRVDDLLSKSYDHSHIEGIQSDHDSLRAPRQRRGATPAQAPPRPPAVG